MHCSESDARLLQGRATGGDVTTGSVAGPQSQAFGPASKVSQEPKRNRPPEPQPGVFLLLDPRRPFRRSFRASKGLHADRPKPKKSLGLWAHKTWTRRLLLVLGFLLVLGDGFGGWRGPPGASPPGRFRRRRRGRGGSPSRMRRAGRRGLRGSVWRRRRP